MTPRPVVRPQEAEALAAEWMRRSGFRDARLTGGSADGGIDVWSRRALAQVKLHGKPVPRAALQQLVGARGRDHSKILLFFANENGYSAPAARYADEMDIALFTYDVWGRVRATNRRARLVERAGRAESAVAVRAGTSFPSGPISARAGGLRWVAAALTGISSALTITVGLALLGVTVVRSEAVPSEAVVLLLVLAAISTPGLTWWVVSQRLRRERSATSGSVLRQAAVGPPGGAPFSGAAENPQRFDNQVPAVGNVVHDRGDVTWFEYRASVPVVVEALAKIHAFGSGHPARIEAAGRLVTIAPNWAQGYPGFRSLTADLERVAIAGTEGVRVHWRVYADATPSTLEAVLDGVHAVTKRVNDMLAEIIGPPVASGPNVPRTD